MKWKQFKSNNQKVRIRGSVANCIVGGLGTCLPAFFSYRTKKRSKRTRLIKETLTLLGDTIILPGRKKPKVKVYSNGLSRAFRNKYGGKFKNVEWLYDVHWYTEANEIKHVNGIIDRWSRTAKDDPVSKRLWNQLSNTDQDLLKNCRRSGSDFVKAGEIIIQALKKFVKTRRRSIYHMVRGIKGFKLRRKTKELLDKNPTKGRLTYLNRLLLQDFYRELSTDYEYQPISLPLVVEIEWDPIRKKDGEVPYGGFKFDFQKLLVANADLRVMILIKRPIDSIVELSEYFDKAIEGCKHVAEDSQFLFIAFDEKIGGFHYATRVKRRKRMEGKR